MIDVKAKKPRLLKFARVTVLVALALLAASLSIAGRASAQSNHKLQGDLLVDLSTLDGTDLADGIGPGRRHWVNAVRGGVVDPGATF